MYSGFNNSNGLPLVLGTDQISVDSTSGSIFVSQFKPVGTYKVKVKGVLPDQITSTFAIFTIIISDNSPPVF